MLPAQYFIDMSFRDAGDLYYAHFIHAGAKAFHKTIAAFVTERVDRLVEKQAKEERKGQFYIY